MEKFWWHISNFFNPFIQGVKNVITYFPVIWKDRDWDYSFMISLEKKKLKKMIKWFEENEYGHCIGGRKAYKQMCLALQLLNIISEEDKSYYTFELIQQDIDISNEERFLNYIQGYHGKWTLNKHVNCNNKHRFMCIPDSMWEKNPNRWAAELYKVKAWKLYHKIRERYMENWWD